MHTAICSFEDRAQAERTVERLVQSGYDRRDVHIKHEEVPGDTGRHGGATPWGTDESSGADKPGVLSSLGHFFTSAFGLDDARGHARNYTDAVVRGLYVVVVDAPDDASALEAQALMHEMEADHAQVIDRSGQPALRDIGPAPQATTKDVERDFGTARDDMPASARDDASDSYEADRALAASHMSEQHTLGTRHAPDITQAPGLRYADKDKPNR